jgi:S1-C subfamily serine protease
MVNNFGSIFKKNKLLVSSVALFIILLLSAGAYLILRSRNIENEIKQIKQQSETVAQQNQQSIKDLSTQLSIQKSATQNALDLVKKQSQSRAAQNNGNFPVISSRAIVLIICFDSSGNALQSGSGTIVSSTGYVLTNKHVVTDSSGNSLSCGAFMNDGSTTAPTIQSGTFYSLTLNDANAGFYTSYDAAVLKIDSAIDVQSETTIQLPPSFPYLRPDGGNLKQGDAIYIFGYPAASGLVFNVTNGIVSSFSSDGTFINTSAVIDHGNSGGAAVTSDGRFIGIPTQKYTADGDYLGQILDVSNLNVPN